MSCEGNNDSQLPAWHVYNMRAKGNLVLHGRWVFSVAPW